MPGSKPGERRGGRQKGTPNKVTAELRGAAQQYTMQALEVLAHVAQHGESESARVSAACALLDRGHGRPTQAVNVGADSSLATLMARIDGRTRGIEQMDHGTGHGGAAWAVEDLPEHPDDRTEHRR